MLLTKSLPSTAESMPLRAGETLQPELFRDIRQQMILEHCKWDPQVGDVSTISPFPLVLSAEHWGYLSKLAGLLAAELMEAERELLMRPELHRHLGLPRRIRRVFQRARWRSATPTALRVLRFDFHWATAGWQISEVNSDVPGGFSEASELPLAFAPHYRGTQPAGNPGAAWATAIARATPPESAIALLAAPGFLEDQQVLGYYARQLEKCGRRPIWASPENLRWHNGKAYLELSSGLVSLAAIVRFYQAEWLDFPQCASLFAGGETQVANPGAAILTESKRFPLVWDQLPIALPTWRRLLPATADPRDVDWRRDETWLLKSALCNTGDTVAIRSMMNDRQWRAVSRAIRFNPQGWIAQKKFTTCGLPSPAGLIYPCIGVYTVDGEPAGIYGRYSRTPLVDYAAIDAAVLIEID